MKLINLLIYISIIYFTTAQDTCQVGYFYDDYSKSCLQCSEGCETCETWITCTTCLKDYDLTSDLLCISKNSSQELNSDWLQELKEKFTNFSSDISLQKLSEIFPFVDKASDYIEEKLQNFEETYNFNISELQTFNWSDQNLETLKEKNWSAYGKELLQENLNLTDDWNATHLNLSYLAERLNYSLEDINEKFNFSQDFENVDLTKIDMESYNLTEYYEKYKVSNLTELLAKFNNSNEYPIVDELIQNISSYDFSNFNYDTFISQINFTQLHLSCFEELSNMTMDELVKKIKNWHNLEDDSLIYEFLLEFEYLATGELSFENTMQAFEGYNLSQYITETKIEEFVRSFNNIIWNFILDEYDQIKYLNENEFKSYMSDKWSRLIKVVIYNGTDVDFLNLDLAQYDNYSWEDSLLHLANKYNYFEIDSSEIEAFISKFDFSNFSNFESITLEAFKKEIEARIQDYLDDNEFNLEQNFTEYIMDKLNITIEEIKEIETNFTHFNWSEFLESKYPDYNYDQFNFSQYFNETELNFGDFNIEELLNNKSWFEDFNLSSLYNTSGKDWDELEHKLQFSINFKEILEQSWMKTFVENLDISEDKMILFLSDIQEQVNSAIEMFLKEIKPDYNNNETEPNETEPNETEPNETEPNETEPNETEPNETEPNETEPNETEPNETEPNETEPNETEPNETEPNETEPNETEPNETEPNETEPNETEPNETEPNETEPNETEPNETEPNETEPNETEPNETEPNETEPNETEVCDPSELEDCEACEIKGICSQCKHGSPFSNLIISGANLTGLCKCPSGMYKYKNQETELYDCHSLQDVDTEETFAESSLSEQSFEELAETSQIAYALQDNDSVDNEQQDSIENTLLDVLTAKVEETAITSENLNTVIDVVKIVNVSKASSIKQTKVIGVLQKLAENSGDLSSDEDFSSMINLATDMSPDLNTAASQIEIETNVLKPLAKNYFKANKDSFLTGTKKQLTLSTGVMEFSKMESEQEFTGAKLKYPDAMISQLKKDDSSSSVMVNVQVTDKNKFKKVGSTATLLVNPMTINNYQMKDDGTVEDSSYEGSDKFSICFEELASLSSPVCMYWDDVKSYWSTEGVTLNTETNCCESIHFSTFGVIKSGEQVIEINNENPGEYGEGLSCSSKTSGCLECDAETGECLKCIGYFAPITIGDEKTCTCADNQRIIYSADLQTWSCLATSEVGLPVITLIHAIDCSSVSPTLAQLQQIKEIAYQVDTEETMAVITSKLIDCKATYSVDDLPSALLLQAEILNGIMKTTSDNLQLTTMSEAVEIAEAILDDELSTLNIYLHLMEFFGLATQKFQAANYEALTEENDIAMQSSIKIKLQAKLTTCVELLLKQQTPTETQPKNYHFSNAYIRIGQLVTSQDFTSLLYFDQFGIQFAKDLLSFYISDDAYYFIHMIQKLTPYSISTNDQSKSSAQYFRIYDKDFVGTENTAFVHCGDNAPIKFQYSGESSTIALKTWKNDEWANKVLCYNDEEAESKICFPASYSNQYLFIIDEIESFPFTASDCSIEDIPGCSVCNSEKECLVCEYGAVLYGENNDYYGRCECPSGYYKYSFIETSCNKTEYLQEAWELYADQFETITVCDSEFLDRSLMVIQLNDETALQTYMAKLASLIDLKEKISTDALFKQILSLLDFCSQSAHKLSEKYYYSIFGVIQDYIKDITIEREEFANIIQIGEKILFKMNDRNFKSKLYSLIFKQMIISKYFEIPPTFTLENGQLTIQKLEGAGQINIDGIKLTLETKQWEVITAETCESYYILSHNMGNQNPYDYIQIAEFYSSIVDFDLLCYKESSLSIIDKLTLDYYQIEFTALDSGDTSAKCVYWDETANIWSSTGGRAGEQIDYNNKCEWSHFTTFAIIKDNSASTICNPECAECSSYDYCTKCEASKYLINGICYSSSELDLDMILTENQIIYIISFENKKCLGVDIDNDNALALYSCNEASVSYQQILWKVTIDGETYKFTNVYLEETSVVDSTLKYDTSDLFNLQKISDISDNDLFTLYKNEARLKPAAEVQCFSNLFSLTECTNSDNKDMSLWWEFLPKKSTDHDPMPLEISLEDDDSVEIIYDHSKESDIEDVVFILAGEYPTTLNSLNTLSCSSTNLNSYVNFIQRESDAQVIASLSSLLNCGFVITEEDEYYILSGKIIHVFPDTLQVFYNNLEIKFATDIEIIADVVNAGQITQIYIQQQGLASQLDTQFVATVSLDEYYSFYYQTIIISKEGSSSLLEVTNDFVMKVSLPSTVTSKFSITVPDKGSFQNAELSTTVPLELTKSNGDNSYLIQVTINGIADGQYRLKFSCVMTLESTLLRRVLSFFTRSLSTSSSKVGLIIDKSFSVNNTQTNGTSSTDTPIVYDNSESTEESDETMTMNVGIILLIVLSALVAVALILGIVYYAVKIQKNKRMREKMEAVKNNDSGRNLPQIEIEQLQSEVNKI